MMCSECGGGLQESTDGIASQFRDEMVDVEGIPHLVCSACGEIEFDLDNAKLYSDAVKDAYRRKHGLLSPKEIKALRKSLGFTQEEFQIMLGVGKTAVSRWETGALVQQKPEDNLMRLSRNHTCATEELIGRAGLVEKRKRSMDFPVCTKKELPIDWKDTSVEMFTSK